MSHNYKLQVHLLFYTTFCSLQLLTVRDLDLCSLDCVGMSDFWFY